LGLTITVAFGAVEAVKWLLIRAKLLRTDIEIQVAEIYANSSEVNKMIKELWEWHKPDKTDTGTTQTWKTSAQTIVLIQDTHARVEKIQKVMEAISNASNS